MLFKIKLMKNKKETPEKRNPIFNWLIFLYSIWLIGCTDNRRGADFDPGSPAVPNWTTVGAKTKIPIDYELEYSNREDPIGETIFTILLINQKLEQNTITCTIFRGGSIRKKSYKITIPGNGRSEFYGDYDDSYENLIYPGDTVVVSSNFYNEKIDIQIPGKRKPRPPVPIDWSIAKTFFVVKGNRLQDRVGCEISMGNPTFNNLKIIIQSYRKDAPVILGEEHVISSKDRILIAPKSHDEIECFIAGDRIIVSAPRYSPVELKIPENIKVESIDEGLMPPLPEKAPLLEIPAAPRFDDRKNKPEGNGAIGGDKANLPLPKVNGLDALRGLGRGMPGIKDDEIPALEKDASGKVVVPEALKKGLKYRGKAGQAIGLDANQLPLEIPRLPPDIMTVNSPEGQVILSNAKSYWICYHEYWRLSDILRYCDAHGITPSSVMTRNDIKIWGDLCGPALKTGSGASIFDAPLPAFSD
jgi:hypothetical protein